MKIYIGAKIIGAEPMFEGEFAAEQGRLKPVQNRAGYKVWYEDGYLSWSPQETFERAYRLLGEGEFNLIFSGKGL